MLIPLMSPRNDVNRTAKLARRLRAHQYNIALDSGIGEKESLRPLKTGGFCATGTHPNKKSAPLRDALDLIIKTRNRAKNQASDLTRDDRRDILRAAVFLCITPLVTPRISSGCAAFSAAAAAA